MVTMKSDATRLARALKRRNNILITGGPFPTSQPEVFLQDFDAVVVGEGEVTMLELARKYLAGDGIADIRGIALCDELERRKLAFRWDCLCRVDNVDPELFKRMHEAGCARVFFGIESGDDGVMRLMGKRFTGHNLLMFSGDFSQAKLRFAIYKGTVQHRLRKYGLTIPADVFEKTTNAVFRAFK